eukprot:TRINITY_DN26111_c0_g1_i2.p1 TRINITY_DN26111_c0_g1~~TRINITY_DN26111_c0_g1_i2.p1  ORF type:complete len:1008 (-),score=206.10 TRINITY_DN26111_c0_g1_i2:62-3085(-)
MLPVCEKAAVTAEVVPFLPPNVPSLPRLSTPSLQYHFWNWSKQQSNLSCASTDDGEDPFPLPPGTANSTAAARSPTAASTASTLPPGTAGSINSRIGTALSHGASYSAFPRPPSTASSHYSRLGTALSHSVSLPDFRREHLLSREKTEDKVSPPDTNSERLAARGTTLIKQKCQDYRKTGLPHAPHGLQPHRRVRGFDLMYSGDRTAAMISAGLNEEMATHGQSKAGEGDSLKAWRKRMDKRENNKRGSLWNKAMVGNVKKVMLANRLKPKGKTKLSDEDAERAEELMKRLQFFQMLESTSPGLISELSRHVEFQAHPADQVLFRQDDPPSSCWVVVSGSVSVKIWKKGEEDDKPPTPRASFAAKKYLTLEEVAQRLDEREAKGEDPPLKIVSEVQSVADPSEEALEALAEARKVMKEESGIGRYRCIEGFSTFTLRSTDDQVKSQFGIEVVKLGAGSLFGELALQNHNPRAATIQCLEDTEFMTISSDVYARVLADIMQKARLAANSLQILQKVDFFKKLEDSSPGISREMAMNCQIHEEVAEQVLFRQDDPPRDCYIVEEGEIDIYVFDHNVKGKHHKAHAPTPRDMSKLNMDRMKTVKEVRDQWLKAYEEKKQISRKRDAGFQEEEFDLWYQKAQKYKCTEGFSSFGKESKFGKHIVTLGAGSIVGELALQTDANRAATVKCKTAVKFLLITKDVFQKILGNLVKKVKFFNASLPGLKQLKYRESNPCTLFQKRIFPRGFKFLFEGIVAPEPAIFVIVAGTVEFRRFTRQTENWAYFQASRPLSEAHFETVTSPGSLGMPVMSPRQHHASDFRSLSGKNGDGNEGKEKTSGHSPSNEKSLRGEKKRASSMTSPRGSKPEPRSPSHTLGQSQSSSFGKRAPGSRDDVEVVCETYRDDGVFCSLPFMPLGVPEPFTVVAHTDVEAYHCGGPNTEKLPVQLLNILKEHFMKNMEARMRTTEMQSAAKPSKPPSRLTSAGGWWRDSVREVPSSWTAPALQKQRSYERM